MALSMVTVLIVATWFAASGGGTDPDRSDPAESAAASSPDSEIAPAATLEEPAESTGSALSARTRPSQTIVPSGFMSPLFIRTLGDDEAGSAPRTNGWLLIGADDRRVLITADPALDADPGPFANTAIGEAGGFRLAPAAPDGPTFVQWQLGDFGMTMVSTGLDRAEVIDLAAGVGIARSRPTGSAEREIDDVAPGTGRPTSIIAGIPSLAWDDLPSDMVLASFRGGPFDPLGDGSVIGWELSGVTTDRTAGLRLRGTEGDRFHADQVNAVFGTLPRVSIAGEVASVFEYERDNGAPVVQIRWQQDGLTLIAEGDGLDRAGLVDAVRQVVLASPEP